MYYLGLQFNLRALGITVNSILHYHGGKNVFSDPDPLTPHVYSLDFTYVLIMYLGLGG